ncbi:MAG: TlpA disulfide reductase family protein [Polyangiaceae bacterium]
MKTRPALVLVTLLPLLGCDVEVPPFPAGQGQAKTAISYPGGPYGVTKTSVITNFELAGFPAPAASADPTALVPITLADFYNPTGDGVYPAGSPYGEGQPKPKALLIDIGAVWCTPCQFEAKTILPKLYEQYKPLGAEFLFDLADGPKGGIAATPTELVSWVKKYKSTFPCALDPERKLGASFNTDSFPVNILVDTRTMQIVDVVAGVPDEGGAFFQNLDALLKP